MNRISLRLKKNNKKAITPVIATIILIAVTLVLALVVGAYTFGLFGSNVKTVTLTSALLNSGSASSSCAGANFQMTFNDPGGNTYISSLSLSAGGVAQSMTYYYETTPGTASTCASLTLSASTTNGNAINGGTTTQLDVFFATTGLNSGSTYSYVITFANGQSISGSLIAQ